jgi:hypothetical protein
MYQDIPPFAETHGVDLKGFKFQRPRVAFGIVIQQHLSNTAT